MCTTTLLELEAKNTDPMIAIPERVLMEYISLWLREVEFRKQIEHGWQRILSNILKAREHKETKLWHHVKGPVANTVCTLLDMGWVPETSTRWVDNEKGVAWELGEEAADM